MKTYQKRSLELPQKARPTGIERVRFHDGMLVSADDLDAASTYPASLLQSVLRAYFGCGVVCGLGLQVRRTLKDEPVWTVCVDPGLAVDCQGQPIELAAPVELDLSPDACGCEEPPDRVLIAVRRASPEAAPRESCSCGDDGPPHVSCRRLQDQVLVKAFTEADLDAVAGGVCRREPATGQERIVGATAARTGDEVPGDVCQAMTECSTCTCDAVWVLLGEVRLDPKTGVQAPDVTGRRWIKPVEALCTLARTADLLDRVTRLEETVSTLAGSATGNTTASTTVTP